MGLDAASDGSVTEAAVAPREHSSGVTGYENNLCMTIPRNRVPEVTWKSLISWHMPGTALHGTPTVSPTVTPPDRQGTGTCWKGRSAPGSLQPLESPN